MTFYKNLASIFDFLIFIPGLGISCRIFIMILVQEFPVNILQLGGVMK